MTAIIDQPQSLAGKGRIVIKWSKAGDEHIGSVAGQLKYTAEYDQDGTWALYVLDPKTDALFMTAKSHRTLHEAKSAAQRIEEPPRA